MTTLYDTFGTDQDLEKGSGVTLDYGDAGSITIHRAGGGNRKFYTVMDAVLKPHRHAIQNKTLDKETDDRLMAEIYAKSVIIGWSGVKGRDGKKLPFNEANAIKLLTDLPDLFADIRANAMSIDTFRKEAQEQEAKNSAKS
ncbi:MAG: hypothetical protein CMM93_02360 [Rickettsiales bacterium]|nr:hypothetical protein [Rickettsiales bacterium]